METEFKWMIGGAIIYALGLMGFIVGLLFLVKYLFF